MKNKSSCNCKIGIVNSYEGSELVDLEGLICHIKSMEEFNEYCDKYNLKDLKHKVFSLSDYCDGRKSTDLTRFKFCPECGKKINWKEIKGDKK